MPMHNRLHGPDYYQKTDLPLSVFRAYTELEFPLHSHDFEELVVVVGGKGWHIIGEYMYPISAGDVFVISGSTEHAYQNCNDLEIFNVLFDSSKLKLPLNDIYEIPAYFALFSLEASVRGETGDFHHHLHLEKSDMPHIKGILQQISNELSTQEPGYRAMAAGLFVQAVVFLSRRYASMNGAKPQKLVQLGRVLSYIERHLSDTLTLDHLAQVAGVSISTLQRSFQQVLSVSPIEYINRLRFERAADMLRHTDMTIADAAFRAGFSDSNYFSRQFRARYGCTPRNYRKAGISVEL